MSKITIFMLSSCVAMLFTASGQAEQASTNSTVTSQVTWQNPEKFTDIRPANSSRKKYQERVQKSFNDIFSDFSAKLPAGYQLKINVTDLDLAGDVNPMYRFEHHDIRVIKEIYFPKMTLDYQLLNPQGQEVAAVKGEKLRDLAFMNSSPIGSSRMEFYYEREMIKRWFQKKIIPLTKAETSNK